MTVGKTRGSNKASKQTAAPKATQTKVTRTPFSADTATMAKARARLSAIVDKAKGGGEVVIHRWDDPMYRVGPLTILTAAERERAVEINVTELRENLSNECSRMAQTLRPILITRSSKPVAALWRAKEAVASDSELAAVNLFREQFDNAFAEHRRVLLRDFVAAMHKLLKSTLPTAMREAAEPVIRKALAEKLDGVAEDVAAEITDLVVEGIATSDRMSDLIRVLASRIEE